MQEVTLTMKLTEENGKTIAMAVNENTGVTISVEKNDPASAAAELVKYYFAVNKPQVAILPPNETLWRQGGLVVTSPGDINATLQRAIENDKDVVIERYKKPDESITGPRTFRPHELRGDLVIGYDYSAGNMRSFRVNQIKRLRTT